MQLAIVDDPLSDSVIVPDLVLSDVVTLIASLAMLRMIVDDVTAAAEDPIKRT